MTRRVDQESGEGYTGTMTEPRDSEIPPDPDSSDPTPRDSRRRRLVESVIPEILKRAVELGVERAQQAPDDLKQFVGDRKLPKEIAHYLFQQIDETKNGLFRVVAKEIRDFLEHTNFAGEVQKLLTTVQFEVNTTIRFTPNDGPKPPKKGDKADKDAEARAEGAPNDEEAGEERGADDANEAPSEPRVTSLPKPEVRTAVSVRRDERDRRRRRDAG